MTKATVTPLSDHDWSELQAVVYFWVRSPLSQQVKEPDKSGNDLVFCEP